MKRIEQQLFTGYAHITPNGLPTSMPFPEDRNSLVGGVLTHLAPALLFCILTDVYHFDPIKTFFIFIGVTLLTVIQILVSERCAPAVALSQPEKKEIIDGLIFLFFTGVCIGSMVVMLVWFGCHPWLPKYTAPAWIAIWLTVAGADFFYYFIHRFFNHSQHARGIFRWFHRNHGKHHAVKALDFFRGNNSSLADTSITSFQIPCAVIGTFLGLNLTQVLVAYALLMMLQSTHHVNYTFNIGWLRYIFVDNHNHKLHHCPRGYLVNYGAVFSIWDRLFGTFYENWNVSSSYMEKHRIALPIQPKK